MINQQEEEKNFKKMLDNNPNNLCVDVVDYLIDNFKERGFDITNFKKMLDEKKGRMDKKDKKGVRYKFLVSYTFITKEPRPLGQGYKTFTSPDSKLDLFGDDGWIEKQILKDFPVGASICFTAVSEIYNDEVENE